MNGLSETQEILLKFSRIFQRRKKLILLMIFAILVPVTIYNYLAQPQYEAYSLVVFEEINTPLGGFGYDFSREIYIQNQLEEIQSASFAADILSQLPPSLLRKIPLDLDANPVNDSTEFLIQYIQENISAFPVKNSNVVKISFQSPEYELSALLANTAANVLQQRNYEIKKAGASGTRHFIEKQLAYYKAQLDSSENQLKLFKEKNQVTSVGQETEEILRRITEAEVLLNSVISDKGSVETELEAMKTKLEQQENDLAPQIQSMGAPWAQKLREQLIDLNFQYLQLQIQGYDPTHPKMVELKSNIEKIQKDLNHRLKEISSSAKMVDPVKQIQQYVNQSISLQIKLESLKAREAALRDIIQKYDQKLNSLPGKELTLAKLTRSREVNQKIFTMLLEKREEARIAEAEQLQNIRIIDTAAVKPQILPKPVSPQKKLNWALGGILGLLLGIGLAFVVEYRHSEIENPDEVESVTEWPILGTIPDFDQLNPHGLYRLGRNKDLELESESPNFKALLIGKQPHHPLAESFRMLRTSLHFSGLIQEHRTLLLTSLGPDDGKTTLVTNIGCAFAELGKKTLIIDSDLHIPHIHEVFESERDNGLAEVLNVISEQLYLNPGYESPEEILSHSSVDIMANQVVRETGIENLHFISGGKKLKTPSQYLSMELIQLVLQKYRQEFEIILIDTPPILLINDAIIFASQADATALVIPPNKYDRQMIERGKKMLKKANVNVLGVIMNRVRIENNYRKYYYKYYRNELA
ncbi:MAG: hypothetical protein Kow0037_25600 [Calditrichia bacterium]